MREHAKRFFPLLALLIFSLYNAVAYAAQQTVPSGDVYEVVYETANATDWSIQIEFQARGSGQALIYAWDSVNGTWKYMGNAYGEWANPETVSWVLSASNTIKVKVVIQVTYNTTPDYDPVFTVHKVDPTQPSNYWKSEERRWTDNAVVTVETRNPVVAALYRIGQLLVNVLKKVANAFLSLLPDWLSNILKSSWSIIKGFASPLFSLLSDIFKIYPFIFMLVSLKYILSGDMEGWINYVLMHVKVLKIFIDLGLKLVELLKP